MSRDPEWLRAPPLTGLCAPSEACPLRAKPMTDAELEAVIDDALAGLVSDVAGRRKKLEPVLAEVRRLSTERAAVLAQVEAAMTEANRQGGSLHRVWTLLAPALEMLRKGQPAGPAPLPEHTDEQYHGDHWATGECPRCALEIALGWRTDRAGGKTAAEHLKLRGYIEPEAARVVGEGLVFIREQVSGDWRSLTGDRISRIAERAEKVLKAIGAVR